MNAGGRLDDAIHTVRVPARLAARPYLQPVYDEPEFIVHTVWRQYGGWWDGNPATLKPAPERAPGRPSWPRWPAGPGALADRALELLADATTRPSPSAAAEGRCAWPATWPSTPGWPTPTTRACSGRASEVFAARAARATSTMARGVFTWAANESARRRAAHPHVRTDARGRPSAAADFRIFLPGSIVSARWTRR